MRWLHKHYKGKERPTGHCDCVSLIVLSGNGSLGGGHTPGTTSVKASVSASINITVAKSLKRPCYVADSKHTDVLTPHSEQDLTSEMHTNNCKFFIGKTNQECTKRIRMTSTVTSLCGHLHSTATLELRSRHTNNFSNNIYLASTATLQFSFFWQVPRVALIVRFFQG